MKRLTFIILILSLIGCAPTTRELFNEYQQAHLYETRPTDKGFDLLVTVRIRGFGDAEQKRRTWCAAWPVFCRPDMPAAGMSVSNKIPEIWIDLRENDRGEIILPDHILSHEMNHTLKLLDGRVHDPDR